MAKTYNSIPTVSTGDVYTATAHNNIVTNTNNYRVPPMCRVRRNSRQTIAHNTLTLASFNTQQFDTEEASAEMWVVGDPTKITIRTAGVYQLTGGVVWDIGATGIRAINLRVNGTTIVAHTETLNGGASNFTAQTVATTYSLAASDYFELTLYHSQGTNLDARGDYTEGSCYLAATWLGQVS